MLLINLLNSQEKKENSNKESQYIELLFGGGLSGSINLIIFKTRYNINSWSYDDYYTRCYISPFINWATIIPVSFIYYPSVYFGFGLTVNVGFEYYYYYYYNQPFFLIISKCNLVNKIGNIKTGHFLLLEYGLSIFNSFDFFEYPLFNNNTKHCINILYIGPNIFIGYEIKNNKFFSFAIGSTFDFMFPIYELCTPSLLKTDYYDYISDSKNLNYTYIGVELRWRFSFMKSLTK